MEIHLAKIIDVSDPYGDVIIIVVAVASLFKLIDHIINSDNTKQK